MRRLNPSLTTWVIVSASMFAAFASLVTAWSAPPLNSADEAAHLDYAIDVWHGHLPVFENGLTIRPDFGILPPVQWVAQHPPLFYTVLAPFVGPLWDAGHEYASVLAGRSVNAVFAAATVFAVGWATRRVVPRRPTVAAVAAVVVSLTSMFLLVGGSIYNDLPNMLFGALAIGVGATALRSGLSTRLVISGAVVTTLGMLTRLSFAVFLVAVVVAFLLASWRRSHFWGDWRGHLVGMSTVIVAPGLASGWFWLRNRALTGSIVGNHPGWGEEHLGRRTMTAAQVIGDPTWWSRLFATYRGHLPGNSDWTYSLLLGPIALSLIAVVIGIAAFVLRRVRRARSTALAEESAPRTAALAAESASRGEPRPRQELLADVLVGAMLAALAVLVVVGQVRFSMSGGNPNVRYSLGLMPILAIVMSIGLTGLGRLIAPVVTVLWMELTGYIWFQIQNLSTPAFGSVHALTVSRLTFAIALVFLTVTIVGVCVLTLRNGGTPGGARGRSGRIAS